MKKMLLMFVVAIFSVSFTFAQNDKMMSEKSKMEMKEKSLYERLGGYDALAAVTDDFAGRLATDKKLGKYFVGLSDDSMKKLRQHVIDFLCLATGGPCAYTGRDMKLVHTGLEITEEEWDISVDHLKGTLNKFKVPEKEKGEVLTAIGSLKKDIVEKKK
jgi:hemoglobin